MKPVRSLPIARLPMLGERLDRLLREVDGEALKRADPVQYVHRFLRDEDRELVGLVAALLAFGNVVAVRRSIEKVLAVLGPRPASFVRRTSDERLRASLSSFVHRVYRGDDVAFMLRRAAELQRSHGSIGAFVLASSTRADLAVPEHALSRAAFHRATHGLGLALRGDAPSRGLAHLVPDVTKGSAVKRLALYLRWMCRPRGDVDLGLFPFPASELVIPVDTHIHRIAKNLGLTRRADASFRTAVEITEALARIDPEDPVKYDFALCHLGVSRACPSRRRDTLCSVCVLQPVCVHWSRRKAPAPRISAP